MSIGRTAARGRLAALVAIGLAFGVLTGISGAQETSSLQSRDGDGVLEQTAVFILTRDGQIHKFSLELADDPQERQKGLMHRESLAENSGMLFDFGQTRRVSMWMKDTLIALDMLFVASDGEILSIAENARPGSLRQIGSGADVRSVVEIVGGLSRKLGIRPGDRAIHASFNNTRSLDPDAVSQLP